MNEVIWHDIECGSYEADLPLWDELARATGGPVLELGCGTGRVVFHLARHAPLVIGVDCEPDLVAAIWERMGETNGDAELDDVCEFHFSERFDLVLAPMQLIQLLAGSDERVACLACTHENLTPGGRAAFAIVEDMPEGPSGGTAAPPLPDVREIEGWIYSSLPLEPLLAEGSIFVRRLRQTVSPDGELSEDLNEVELRMLSAEILEQEAMEAGLRAVGRREIPPTEAHVGSTVVIFEKEA
jgi:SAM-dependent methyltransferase